jgi:type II secretory pathway component PulC
MLAWLLLAALAPAPSDITVLGIVLHRVPERCTAVLHSGDRTRVVGAGDSAFGGQVVSVSASGVVLEFEGGRVLVPLALVPRATPAPSPSPATQPSVRDAAEAVEDPATPHRLMARGEVERRLGTEIPRILAETALAPVIEDGHVTGLAVTRVPEGTVLSDAGLRSGDVIKQINDTVIDGMGTLIGLWPRLQGATELRAVVQRGGRLVVLSVTLR